MTTRYSKVKRLADESPFEGERIVAKEKMKSIRNTTDPRLSNEQFQLIEQLSGQGYKVTYEFGGAQIRNTGSQITVSTV